MIVFRPRSNRPESPVGNRQSVENPAVISKRGDRTRQTRILSSGVKKGGKIQAKCVITTAVKSRCRSIPRAMPPIPTFDDNLLLRLTFQVAAVSNYQNEDKAGSQEMVNGTQSLKNISEAILYLKTAGVVRIDQETAAVMLDKLRNPDT